MTNEEIEARVVGIVVAELQLQETVWNGLDTFDQLGADSLDQVKIVAAVEDEFEVTIADADIYELDTVAKVVDHVAGLLAVTA